MGSYIVEILGRQRELQEELGRILDLVLGRFSSLIGIK
jgi:hypothetical protein